LKGGLTIFEDREKGYRRWRKQAGRNEVVQGGWLTKRLKKTKKDMVGRGRGKTLVGNGEGLGIVYGVFSKVIVSNS